MIVIKMDCQMTKAKISFVNISCISSNLFFTTKKNGQISIPSV